MRSTIFLGLFAAGFGAVALLGAGCGGEATTGTGGTGGGATSSSSATTTSSTGVTTSTTSSGTGGAGGSQDGCGTTFADATELTPNDGQGAQCQLPDPLVSQRIFKFTGKKGDVAFIQTDAKPTADETDPTYPDLVVTLLDDKQVQLARNDDPYIFRGNDSELWTVLPADGTYFIQVEECNKALGPNSCADSAGITNFDFAIGVGVIVKDPVENPNFTFETEPNNDPTAANPVLFAKGSNGSYFISQIYGDFSSTTDTDVYEVTAPADFAAPAANERVVSNFTPLPWGADANGSTAAIGTMKLVDAADLTKDYALLDLAAAGDPAGLDLSPHIDLMKKYYLFVQRPAGSTAGKNDFYIVWNYGFTSNPLEQNDTGNNTAAGAEALVDALNPNFLAQYFLEGDLPTATDLDHYKFDVPATAKHISVICGGQRSGSGLRNLKVELLNGATSLTSVTEAADKDAFIDSFTLPTPLPASLVVKLSSGTPSATVTTRFYRCGISITDQ